MEDLIQPHEEILITSYVKRVTYVHKVYSNDQGSLNLSMITSAKSVFEVLKIVLFKHNFHIGT